MKTRNHCKTHVMNFRSNFVQLLLAFICGLTLQGYAATPKLATLGQVGPAAGGGNNYVLLMGNRWKAMRPDRHTRCIARPACRLRPTNSLCSRLFSPRPIQQP